MNTADVGWSQVEIAGHAADVFDPPERNPHGYVVIYLHGVHLGRLVENPLATELLTQHGLTVVAPHTGRSWWTDKICPEFDAHCSAERHVLDRIMPWIEQHFGATPPAVALLGTSMGGQGALRLAFRHPRTFPIAAAISPAIDYHNWYYHEEAGPLMEMYPDPEAARQDTATLHVHPLNWPRNFWFCCDPTDQQWFEGCDRLQTKLSALGILHDCDLETVGGGHGWHYYNQMLPQAVAFVVAALEKERLRVV